MDNEGHPDHTAGMEPISALLDHVGSLSPEHLAHLIQQATRGGLLGVEARPDGADLAIEIADEDGALVYVNAVWRSAFPKSECAIWHDWRKIDHRPRLESSHASADYFIPINVHWHEADIRTLDLGRRDPPGRNRVFGHVSHRISVSDCRLVVTIYIDETAYVQNGIDVHLALETAGVLLDGIYYRKSHRSGRFAHYSKPLMGVGGDFVYYRMTKTAMGRVDFVVVGDCAGKRMSAALQNAMVGAGLSRYLDDTATDDWDAADALQAIDKTLCGLVLQPERGAKTSGSTLKSPDLFTMGVDACAVVVREHDGSVDCAVAQMPVYLLTLPGRKAKGPMRYRIEQIGSEAEIGKNLGPARLKDGDGHWQWQPVKIAKQRFVLDKPTFIIACTDGFSDRLPSPDTPLNDGKPIERAIHAALAACEPWTASEVVATLKARWETAPEQPSQQDDALVAVLACQRQSRKK